MVKNILEFPKNIPKHLDTLKGWINEFIASLANGANQLFKGFEAALELLADLGVIIAQKLDPNTGKVLVQGTDGIIYTIKQNDETIFEGTEDAIKKFAQKIDEIRSSGGNTRKKVQNHLDEIETDLKHIFTQITDSVLTHANKGEFSLPANPKKSTLPGKMKGGGHGQDNIDFLNKIGRKHKIEYTFDNGVRIGSIEGHKHKVKQLIKGINNTGQAWFPEHWSESKIKQAYEYVIKNNLEKFKHLQDGPPPLFDIYEDVRVGIIKTKGKPATIFADNAKQPIKNTNKFETNPFEN